MGALAQLSKSTVSIEPGRSETVSLTVHNDGTVVDRYSFEALGQAAPWVTFNPTSLSLFPGASGPVDLIVSPPRGPTTPAGPVPLGVRVASSEDPAGSVVEEVTVHVGAFSDITVELVPSTLSGRVAGRARLAVDNRSNCSYRAEVAGTDPKGSLRFSFRPGIITVPPGNAVFVKLVVRPSRRIWRGAQRNQPFRVALHNDQSLAVTAASGNGAAAAATTAPERGPAAPPVAGPTNPHREEVFADGSMLQVALLPRWLGAAAAALAVLVVLWFGLLRPQIHSYTQDQVNKQVASVLTGGTGGSGTKVDTTGGGGTVTPVSPSEKGTGTGTGKSTGAKTSAPTVVSTSEIDGGKQATGNGTFMVLSVPDHQFLEVTDLLVENAAGNTGVLTLADNGKTLMQWAMVDFRDLDYHWITPTVFGPGTKVELIVSGCGTACSPGIYYAGHMVSVPG